MAANHICGLGNPVPTATATLVAAILVISAMPALAQQPSADRLKGNAQNVVKITLVVTSRLPRPVFGEEIREKHNKIIFRGRN